MLFNAKLVGCLVLLSICSGTPGVAKDKFMIQGDVPESMIDMSQVQLDQRQAFFRAPPGPKKEERIKRLFSNPTAEFINARCSDPDTSIALYAAWKRLELQVIARHIGPDRGSTKIKVPRKLTREFLGFVEGRLSITLPQHWTKMWCTPGIVNGQGLAFPSPGTRHGAAIQARNVSYRISLRTAIFDHTSLWRLEF